MYASSWERPPTDVLGQTLPIQQFIARTDHAVVALQHVIAFPEGCALTLLLAVRRGSLDDMAWQSVLRLHSWGDPDLGAPEGDLRLGVRFPDGYKATTAEHAFPGWTAAIDRPERPLLVEAGGGSASDDHHYDGSQSLWLCPLPPPGPFEFVVEWRNLGLDLTSTTLEGSAIVRAAELAVPFWD